MVRRRRVTTTRALPSDPVRIPRQIRNAGLDGDPEWVSKSDLTRYARCEYSAWLLETGQISFEETVDEFQLQLIHGGVEFQDGVEAAAIERDVTPEQLPAVLNEPVVLLNTPDFRNEPWKIHGRPDGIDAAEGALIPIEVKSHKDVQPIDVVELAFYWMLLQPYRTVDPGPPRGWLCLRRDGTPHWVEVPIPLHRFREVYRLLDVVRRARQLGVQPRICACQVCSHVRRDDVYRAAIGSRDLTLIWGIGRHYAHALEAEGIPTWDVLLVTDSEKIHAALKAHKYSRGIDEINRWKHHAHAWSTGEPFVFGSSPFESDRYIAIDLEYQLDGFIWLVGICVVRGGDRESFSLWADDTRMERRNLRQLAAIVADNPELPVVTWSGECADVPRLRDAAKCLRLGRVLEPFIERHVDLYQRAVHNIRLPIPTMGLKEIGEYLGIPRTSTVSGGMQAQMMFDGYRFSRDDDDRTRIRETLTAYNRDDVDGLISVADRFRELSHPPDDAVPQRVSA
jgi:predicted RecB family nuclease